MLLIYYETGLQHTIKLDKAKSRLKSFRAPEPPVLQSRNQSPAPISAAVGAVLALTPKLDVGSPGTAQSVMRDKGVL